MKETIFTGSGVAIVTPMNESGKIDYDVYADLLEFQIQNSTDAIVVCGTTGEASTLTDDEHIDIIKFTVEKVAGRVPVIAGTGSNDTDYAIMLSKEAEKVGVDALLQVTPYYNKTSQRGLIRHFTAIADSTDLPVILYNVPSRTGMAITSETYFQLSKHPKIVATKDASGDFSQLAKTAMLCGDDLAIYSGNDDQIVATMALGGKGIISVLANIAPRETHDIAKLWLDGDHAESLALQLEYLPLIESLFTDVNPIPVKEAVNILGYKAGECRMPLAELGQKDRETLIDEMKKKKLI